MNGKSTRMMKPRRTLLILAILIAFAWMAAPFMTSPVLAADEYRIGCAFAVTGKASWLGEPQKNTVEMIAKEINDAGGINGKKLRLFIEDTQGQNTRAVNAVKKLIKKNRVAAIIGPSRSGTSMAAIPVAQQANIPMISCASAVNIISPVKDRKWIFKTAPNDSDAVHRIFAHARGKNITSVGIITGTTGFGDAGRTQLKAIAPEYGITIAADETYAPGDSDMTAQLVRIKNSGAGAIINWSIVPAQSIVPRNIRQLKIDIPLYQSHGFANVKYAKAAGESAEGTIFPAGFIMAAGTVPDDHPQKAVLTAYKGAYEKAYNEQVSTFAGHAYDALHLVINALKKVGDDPAKIRDELETSSFTGIGGVFQYSAEDHCGLTRKDFGMLTVKDGEFVIYEQ